MLCFYPKTTGKLSGTMNFSGRIFQRFTNRMVYVKIQLLLFRSGGSCAEKREKRRLRPFYRLTDALSGCQRREGLFGERSVYGKDLYK